MAEVAVIPNVENAVIEKVPVPEDEPVAAEKPLAEEEKVVEAEKEKPKDEKVKGDVKVVGADMQKKALDEFKTLVQEALNNHQFFPPPPKAKTEAKEKVQKEVPPTATTTETTNKKKVVTAEVTKVEEKTTPPPATEEGVVSVGVVDDDGAKTVEAIEETVVSVSSVPAEQTKQDTALPAVYEEVKSPEEISIWGIPLLADERSDTALLKFLQARDFKPKEALAMLKKTILWRKEFDIEGLMERNLENPSLEKFAFPYGFDKKGNPVGYNKFGVFQDKELYKNTFGDAEKRKEFLRWLLLLEEKATRQMLDFGPGGVCAFVQVFDFKNSPFLLKRELKTATNEALQLILDNYPELVAKQVFINAPLWYVALQKMISPFLTQRTKSKFVVSGPSKSTETLFKYIAPEQVPVEYGGFSKADEQEFTTADPVTEEIIKPSSEHSVELPFSEACNSLWEVQVTGWDVSYGAEFVPSAEDGFTIIVQKEKKIIQGEETLLSGSFKVDGPGKIVLKFVNHTSKKKILYYRSKIKSLSC